MQEQLITFETAKLAKEKGFDLLVNEFYYVDGKGVVTKDNGDGDSEYICLNHNKYPYYHSAPNQFLLQKWLREVHKIDVFCDCIGGGKYYSVIYDNNIIEGNDKVFEQEKEVSYEEALEIGLQEGLKLIKKYKLSNTI